jgi:uncharacterized protein with PhoU and TrkA domain
MITKVPFQGLAGLLIEIKELGAPLMIDLSISRQPVNGQ